MRANQKKDNKKVLLIGWDAADWKVINPLVDAGKMPNLAMLVEEGTMGNLATLQPVLSPTLWTSIATGKRPYKHGIHGFSEPDPVTGSIRPVTNLSRSTKAIWNILNQEEKDTVTVGWWPSNPAEPLSRGVMVANDFQKFSSNTYEPDKWPLKPGMVHPESLTEKIKEFRVHPAELGAEDLFAFMPGLEGMSQEELDKVAQDPRLQSLMKIIADCSSVHAAATALLANKSWDLASVYYDAIDHFGHAFMKYHPPQRKGISDEDFRLFSYITEAGYRYHDMLLGTLMRLAREIDPDVTIVLISDHGFHPDDLRLSNIPNEPAGPAAEHRQFGIFVANGPGIRRDARIHGANLLDVCPTLLHLFGLPVGEDMDGKVLLDIYQNPPSDIDRIDSWDEVEGDHGMHPPDKQIAPEDSKAALEQLVALGYIEEPDEDQSKALEETVRELDYNVAQSWMDGGIYTEAISILERLYERWPLEHRFGYQLSLCYQSLGRIPELRKVVSQVIDRRLKDGEDAVAELKALKLDDEEMRKQEEEAVVKMNDLEKKKFSRDRRNLLIRSRPNLFELRHFEARADFAEKKFPEALEKVSELEDDFGSRRKVLTLRGEILGKMHRWAEARDAYEEALQIDRETPGPLLGLARIDLAERKYADAIINARASVGLLFFQPRGHYLIGLAHYRLGQIEAAENAFLLTVRQAPLLAAGWRMLGEIAQLHDRDPGKIAFYRQQLKQARERLKALKEERAQAPAKSSLGAAIALSETVFQVNEAAPDEEVVTIVSGLPRSGTSLMMQMLEAAGVPIFTDHKREADDSNLKGYYEHEEVSALLKKGDRSWLADSRGHALKVVAPLLAGLPQRPLSSGVRLRYRILFMEREIEEVLHSQNAMLDRLGKKAPSGNVAQAYQQQISHAVKWVNHHQVPALKVDYHQLVHQPDKVLPEIATFLGVEDQLEAMRAVIDPSMHRARKDSVSF